MIFAIQTMEWLVAIIQAAWAFSVKYKKQGMGSDHVSKLTNPVEQPSVCMCVCVWVKRQGLEIASPFQ